VSKRESLGWLLIVPATALVGVAVGVAVSSAEGFRYQQELATTDGVTDWSEAIRWGVVANPDSYAGLFVGGILGAVVGVLLCLRLFRSGKRRA
jgi:hypothetical protein